MKTIFKIYLAAIICVAGFAGLSQIAFGQNITANKLDIFTMVGSNIVPRNLAWTVGSSSTIFQAGTSTVSGLATTTGACVKTNASGTLVLGSCTTGSLTSILSSSTPISISTSAGVATIGVAGGYEIPTTASISNWNTFYTTPSSQITAGNLLSWSGNTLNSTAQPYYWLQSGSNLYPSSTSWNVGVGTTTPSNKLVVNVGNTNDGILINGASGDRKQLIISEAGTQQWRTGVTSASGNDYNFFDGTSNRITMERAGNVLLAPTTGSVGIGTTTPVTTLEVVGTITATNNAIAYRKTSVSASNLYTMGITGANGFGFQDIGNGGNGFFYAVTKEGLANSQISMSSSTSNNTSFINGLNTTSRVGFGTTSPAYSIDVRAGSGDAVLRLTADPTNVPEDDNPQVRLSQDGNLVNGIFGIGGSTAQYNGAIANATFIEAQDNGGASPLQIVTGGNIIGGTAGTARMTITYAGNVGVGTTTPSTLFTVASSSNILNVTSAGLVGIGTNAPVQKLHVIGANSSATTTTATSDGILRLNPSGSTLVMDLGGTGTNSHGWIQARQSNAYGTFFPVVLNPLGGNVGIGTNSATVLPVPVAKLAINATSSLPATSTAYSTSDGAMFKLIDENRKVLGVGSYPASTGGYWFQAGIDSAANRDIILNPKGGNIGVGSTTPTSRFQLNKVGSDTTSLANSHFYFSDESLDVGLMGQQRLTTPFGFSLQTTNRAANYYAPLNLNPLGGNVGIGTASPSSKLVIEGNSSQVLMRLHQESNGSSTIIRLRSKTSSGNDTHGDIILTPTSASADTGYIGFRMPYSAATPQLVAHSNGNVGVGLVAPDEELHVYGTSDVVTKIQAVGTRLDANSPSARIYLNKDISSGTVVSNDEAGLILVSSDDAANTVGNSHQIKFLTSSVAAGNVTSDIVFQTVASTTIGTLTEAMRIQGGRIGINTSAPGGANSNVLLDTRGHMRAALSSSVGTYYFSSASTNPYLGYGSIADTWTFADNNSYKMAINATTGFVAIGNTAPSSTLQIGTPLNATHSYLQLDFTTSTPASTDCDSQTEVGRTIIASTTARLIYTCWGVQGWATSTPSF